MNRVELKENAMRSLQGHYKDAIILLVLMYLVNLGVGFVLGLLGALGAMLAPVVSIVITGLMGFGYTNYFLKLSRKEEVTYKELFSKSNLMLPYILIYLLTTVFVMLWSLLFFIPGIIASLAYSMVYFIALDNPELSASEVINKSKKMMNGHKLDYFILGLSFFGWAIIGVFTFGLLYLWLIPYMEVTYANFYNQIKEQN